MAGYRRRVFVTTERIASGVRVNSLRKAGSALARLSADSRWRTAPEADGRTARSSFLRIGRTTPPSEASGRLRKTWSERDSLRDRIRGEGAVGRPQPRVPSGAGEPHHAQRSPSVGVRHRRLAAQVGLHLQTAGIGEDAGELARPSPPCSRRSPWARAAPEFRERARGRPRRDGTSASRCNCCTRWQVDNRRAAPDRNDSWSRSGSRPSVHRFGATGRYSGTPASPRAGTGRPAAHRRACSIFSAITSKPSW